MRDADTMTTRGEPIVLVFGVDDNYAMSLAVAVHSALVHLEPSCSVHLYIIDGGISDLNRQRLRRVVDLSHLDLHLELVTPDLGLINDLKLSGHITCAAYLCLLIPDIVGRDFSKAIYLDSDIQVEANLAKLWQENLDGHALLAARDFLIPYVCSPGGVANYRALGLKSELPYFNSGVLVFDLERWRAENISQKVFRYLRHYQEYVDFLDQGALNAVLAGGWGMLDPKWNVASSIFSYDRWPESMFKEEIGAVLEDLIDDPHIIHYIGPNKPWLAACDHPAKMQWHRYLEESGWSTYLEGKCTKDNFISQRSNIINDSLRPVAKVTIAIPTCNRAELLKGCLDSVLSQDFTDFDIVVLDNASSDNTKTIVQAMDDPRIMYVRNETNIGLFGNWNRAVEFSSSPYLTILPDDDVMLPGFIRSSVTALEEYPRVGFTAGLAGYMDRNGTPMHLQDAGELPDGVLDGMEFVEAFVSGSGPTIHPATVMMRSSALDAVEPSKALHSKQLFDLNLYIRLAARFDIFFMRREIAQVRLHEQQIKEHDFACLEGTKPLALTAELTDAIAYLLRSERGEDCIYRKRVTQLLFFFNSERSRFTRALIPGLSLTFTERRRIEAEHLMSVIPKGETFILVDGNITTREFVAGRQAIPFPEHGGPFFGDPPDDDIAIEELDRMIRTGASFIVFSAGAFWWFNHYVRFCNYLRTKFRCVLENKHVAVFDLRS